MTARHRTNPPDPTATGRSDSLPAKEFHGLAPRGMWWVAWRQHRATVAVSLLFVVVIAVALVVFRQVVVARLQAVGCTLQGPGVGACSWQAADAVMQDGPDSWWNLLRTVMWIGPAVLGAFVGAPIFAREVEQRTEVFALTQSVSRIRWWATKITIAGLPLLLGLVGLGMLMTWAADSIRFAAGGPFYEGNFQTRAIIPAAFGLVALAVGITAGIVIRTTVPALVSGLIVTGVIVYVVGSMLRPHLLPTNRIITPLPANPESAVGVTLGDGPDSWFLGSGDVDARGNPVSFDMDACPALTTLMSTPSPAPDFSTKWATAYRACQTEQGIVATYTDYLPGSKLWPLRLVVTGICAVLAALFLGLGFVRLRTLRRLRT